MGQLEEAQHSVVQHLPQLLAAEQALAAVAAVQPSVLLADFPVEPADLMEAAVQAAVQP